MNALKMDEGGNSFTLSLTNPFLGQEKTKKTYSKPYSKMVNVFQDKTAGQFNLQIFRTKTLKMEKENKFQKNLKTLKKWFYKNLARIITWAIIIRIIWFISYVMRDCTFAILAVCILITIIILVELPYFKNKFKRFWPYGWKKRGMIAAIMLCMYLFLVYTLKWYIIFVQQLVNKGFITIDNIAIEKNGLVGAIYMFCEHFWIEILSGIFLYVLIEKKLDKYVGMPLNNGKREYFEVAREMSKSKRGIRILDNDINSYFIGPINENKSKNDMEKLKADRLKTYKFKNYLEEAIEHLDSYEKIEILLLHPNSYAAHQRNNDLTLIKPANFDIFESMREGLKRINEVIIDFNKKGEKYKNKIEVKLFKSTHSIVFASWDDNINFSVLPPSQIDSEETFNMSKTSPLSTYFHQHFDALWKDAEKLNDYLFVTLTDLSSPESKPKEEIQWGADSSNHDLPIFISGSAFRDNDTMLNALDNSKTLQLIHDGEIRFVRGERINSEKDKSLYNFAKERIKRTTEIITTDNHDYPTIYKLKYVHEHKISLKYGNYVNKRLGSKGYCFVPVGMYEIHVGQHVKDLLTALYDFYFDFDKFYLDICPDKVDPEVPNKVLIPLNDSDERVAKRIVAEFYCREYHEEFKFVSKKEGEEAFKEDAKVRNVIGQEHCFDH